MTSRLEKIDYFTGKVNVGVAVGTTLTTLLVAIIIVVVGYSFHKFKSKEGGLSHQLRITSAVAVKQYSFPYILNLNKKIHCFASKFPLLLNECECTFM